ncbi:uncharacterized protein LOC135366033 [Ornithodoros turicata]|uniref:uncharacterized protein LOC135366033 n=1 Tax=Ornithodoros turicata TaxID=34597 RepID=UPI003138BEFB
MSSGITPAPFSRMAALHNEPPKRYVGIIPRVSIQEGVMLGAFGLLITTCTALITLVIANHYLGTPDSSEDYIRDLQAIMRTEVSPCQDFYKYVCGRWDAVHPGDQGPPQMANRKIDVAFERTARGRSLVKQNTIYDKIDAGMRLCRKMLKNKRNDRDSVARFLERFDLRTPYQSDEVDVPHPLTVLVNLALGSSLFILFGIHPMLDLRRQDGSTIMGITEQDMFRDIIKSSDNILNYASAIGGDPSKNSYAKDVQAVHSHIKKALTFASGGNAEYVSLQNLTVHTPHIPVDVWIEAFNAIMEAPLQNDSQIFLHTPLPLKVVDHMVVKCGKHAKILNWITYMVQVYFSDASSSQFSRSIGLENNMCFQYMAHIAPIPVVAKYLHDVTPAGEIGYVRHVYQNMREVFPLFYTWMNNLTRSTSMSRFDKLEPIFTEYLQSPTDLEKMYPYIPEFETPFVESLLAALEGKAAYALHAYTRSKRRAQWSNHANRTSSAVDLDYGSSYHSITTQLLPLMVAFKKSRSLAAWYGRLGPVLAHDIARSYNMRHVVEERDDDITDEEGEYKRRSSCILQLYDKDVVMLHKDTYSEVTLNENMGDVGSLQVALEAAKQDERRPLEGDSRMSGTTNRQLFFISSCYKFCTFERNVTVNTWRDAHARNDHRCNVPVRATRDFYEAFGCAVSESELCAIA